MRKRVVITGMGAISPFGQGVDIFWDSLVDGKSAVISNLKDIAYSGIRSGVAAIVPQLDISGIDRKKRRFMSDMSIYSTLAALEAVDSANLPADILTSRRTGLSVASTIGSPHEMELFFNTMAEDNNISQIKSTAFFKIMNHFL